MNEKSSLIDQAEQFVKEQLHGDSSGHDWWHIYRVRKLALKIARQEGADLLVCELAALLHDVADVKLNGSHEEGMAKVEKWLNAFSTDRGVNEHVLSIISTISYRGGHNPPMKTIEGKVVQDADRLDAIGAIGIARVFAYSGWKGQPIHDPSLTPQQFATAEAYNNYRGTAINHFYEKLLRLKDSMNTEYARRIAQHRHQFLLTYLHQFYAEWEGEDLLI